jgi:hypothetical protein
VNPGQRQEPADSARRLLALVVAVERAMEGGPAEVERLLSDGDGRALVQSHEVRSARFAILTLAGSVVLDRRQLANVVEAEGDGFPPALNITSPSNVPPAHWGDIPESETFRMPWGRLTVGYTHGDPRVRTLSIERNPPRSAPVQPTPGQPRPLADLLATAERAAWAIWENFELSLARDLKLFMHQGEPWEIRAVSVPIPAAWPDRKSVV